MHDHHPTATLDRERIDQLRTFLIDEAVADVATSGSTAPVLPFARSSVGGRRRIAIGVAAALVLGGGLFATNAIAGGPGAARIEKAVAIESEDGWTTIHLLDIDADPQAVLDQLHAAGIEARVQTMAVQRDGDKVIIDDHSAGSDYTGVFTAIGVGGGAAVDGGDHGLVGISVSTADSTTENPAPSPREVGSKEERTLVGPGNGTSGGATVDTTPRSDDGSHDELLQKGVRFGTDGSVSIRNGSGNTVVILTES